MGVEKMDHIPGIIEVIFFFKSFLPSDKSTRIRGYFDSFWWWISCEGIGRLRSLEWFLGFFGLSIWRDNETITELENIERNGQG